MKKSYYLCTDSLKVTRIALGHKHYEQKKNSILYLLLPLPYFFFYNYQELF